MNCQLNLLPPLKKKVITNIYLILYFKVLIEILLGYSLFIASTLFLVSYLIDQNLENFQAQTASIDKEYQKINIQIIGINQKLNNIEYVQKTQTHWSQKFESLFSVNPWGVTLSGLDWRKTENILAIQGRAKTREDFLKYRKALEGMPFIKKLEVPVSTLTIKENIDFGIRAELQ